MTYSVFSSWPSTRIWKLITHSRRRFNRSVVRRLAAIGGAVGAMALSVSPFLDHGFQTRADSLAIVLLSRDNLQPVYLRESEGEHDGYAEGVVLNTRFGSFPHSTLLDIPWGSQVRASNVDTGSRGRKRKRAGGDESQVENETPEGGRASDGDTPSLKAAKQPLREVAKASSGFLHILPPTAELWTLSLPHRTQVVYTPDYSYILQKIRARPGTRIIEAGAGSGSFTHAAARAVYNGYPAGAGGERKGKVFSFECHEDRFHKMTAELGSHGLDGIVRLTHRDVYEDGFLVDGASPEANAVFLDLPRPWLALPHLSRRKSSDAQDTIGDDRGDDDAIASAGWTTPLNPKKSVYISTFSPCIEQVTRTVSAMRRLGWVDIEAVEIANRRIYVSREKVGTGAATSGGPSQNPRDVAEALKRLKDVEERSREHTRMLWEARDSSAMDVDHDGAADAEQAATGDAATSDAAAEDAQEDRPKPWMEGQLLTRSEPELKSHTSYLVFAVLPREWSDEDEAAALQRWPCGSEQGVIGSLDRAARKEQKRQLLQRNRKNGGKSGGIDGLAAAEEPS